MAVFVMQYYPFVSTNTIIMYTNSYDLFLPNLDATKSTMQEALRYEDGRLQRGMYYVAYHMIYVYTRIIKC